MVDPLSSKGVVGNAPFAIDNVVLPLAKTILDLQLAVTIIDNAANELALAPCNMASKALSS